MIDAHLHLWELSRGWYGWNTPDLGALHADSGIAGIATGLIAADVSAAVVVQAADTLDETDWLLEVADREPAIGGVVGYLPLDDPTALEDLLPAYANRSLVGVRQLWHNHGRADELTDSSVLSCLHLLGEAGLAVDVPDAFPALWPSLAAATAQRPGTRFVLDHCGKPPFGDPSGWPTWETGFRELAGRPNVIVKLSGLFGGSGSRRPATADELARVVNLTRIHAGADRTMIGSDWPMTRGLLDYAATMDRLLGLIASWSPAEQAAALSETAQAVYGPG